MLGVQSSGDNQMLRLKVLLITTLVGLCIFGCQDRDKAEGSPSELEAADVARALGMNWWTVQLPADLKPTDYVGLAYKLPDGSVERGGNSVWKAGAKVKVVVWNADGERTLRYAIFGAGKSYRGSVPGKAGDFITFSNTKVLKPDNLLMKLGDHGLSESPDVGPDEIGLILHIERHN